ncbi:MAG: hypothetical protein HY796_13550 [Elusimicrobia bacterium]|nr:hypothetical protein [Elusimicrobiota bacterium]
MTRKRCYLYNFPRLKGEPRIKEPSILYAVPDEKKWDCEFVFDGEPRADGDLYLCSVFTCGYPDFLEFSKKIGAERIIAGGYHPSLRPEDFAGSAAKTVVGFGNNIDEIIKSGRRGAIRGKFRYNHMDRSVFPLHELKEAWYAEIFPRQKSLSISAFMGCPFPCDFSDNCYNFSTYGSRKIFYPLSYIKEELKLLGRYRYDYLFIRDEGFFLHPQFRELVKLLSGTGKRIYSFLGPLGGLTESAMKFLKDSNWFCLTFGFNIREGYAEDRELLRVAGLAHKYGINAHLNIIVKGAEDRTSTYYLDTVARLLFKYLPESMELYFWTPYPGTASFAQYRDKLTMEKYRLLNDLNFKSDSLPLRNLHKKALLSLQINYYKSREYAKIRNFSCGDSLNLQINELISPARK